MEAWPLEVEADSEYKQDSNLDIMVLPVSLAEFWDAFLADDAPYYYLALEEARDKPTAVFANGDWGTPTEGDEEFFGKEVISERMYERVRRLRHNLFANHIHENIYLSLVERTDTRIVLKEATEYNDMRAYDGFDQWVKWDVLTDDPRSHQTVLRQSYTMKWWDYPWGFGRVVQWDHETDFKEDNKRWADFFQDASELFLQGPPYERATQDPEEKEELRREEEERQAAEERREQEEERASESIEEPDTSDAEEPEIDEPETGSEDETDDD